MRNAELVADRLVVESGSNHSGHRAPRFEGPGAFLPGGHFQTSPPLRHMAFGSPSTPSARRNARSVASGKPWVMRSA